MAKFKSAGAYWRFQKELSEERRFFWDKDCKAFLGALAKEASKRAEIVPEGAILWRAQSGHAWRDHEEGGHVVGQVPDSHKPDRMKPTREFARDGRANPKGMPYLYLATDRDTAIAEMRPWKGAIISAGQFKVGRSLKLVSCIEEAPRRFYLGTIPREDWDRRVWSDIDEAFSRPVERSDHNLDYLPTQVIAELFKTQGYDGIIYRSSLGAGNNVALFDLDAANIVNCSLFEVENVSFQALERASRFFGSQ